MQEKYSKSVFDKDRKYNSISMENSRYYSCGDSFTLKTIELKNVFETIIQKLLNSPVDIETLKSSPFLFVKKEKKEIKVSILQKRFKENDFMVEFGTTNSANEELFTTVRVHKTFYGRTKVTISELYKKNEAMDTFRDFLYKEQVRKALYHKIDLLCDQLEKQINRR